tara:strand:- start:3744 stop:3929 length:186 start_codon:yes stop_codon:yes gene_type:complete
LVNIGGLGPPDLGSNPSDPIFITKNLLKGENSSKLKNFYKKWQEQRRQGAQADLVQDTVEL